MLNLMQMCSFSLHHRGFGDENQFDANPNPNPNPNPTLCTNH